MKDASPWIALYAALVATGSAVWQAATFALTGGRVKVQLRVGAMNRGGMVTAPPSSLRPEWIRELAEQGYSAPIVAVRVANVGRQPVTVASWSVVSPRGVSLSPMADSIGPALPHRLEVGESETWAVDMRSVQAFMQTTTEVLGGTEVFGQVELADGRTKRSSETLR